jgi:hypothetical protein
LKYWLSLKSNWLSEIEGAAGRRLLGEPLDGAGNRGSGHWLQEAQVRDLRRTRPCARGFPSVACDAPLAGSLPQPAPRRHGRSEPLRDVHFGAGRVLRGATVSAVTRYRALKRPRSVTAAQVAELRGSQIALRRARFSTASNPGAPDVLARWGGNRSAGSECAPRGTAVPQIERPDLQDQTDPLRKLLVDVGTRARFKS